MQCDETPIRCHDLDAHGETVPDRLWALSQPDGDIICEWRLLRRHAEATTLLVGFKAYCNRMRRIPRMLQRFK